jgi:DNA-binding CsgD family transcriptional regulator
MKLGPREAQLLQLIADGQTAKTAAGIMDLSQHTVNSYIKTIHRKLEANTTTHAVAIAIKNGYIK